MTHLKWTHPLLLCRSQVRGQSDAMTLLLIGSIAIISLVVQAMSYIEWDQPKPLFKNGDKVHVAEDGHIEHMQSGRRFPIEQPKRGGASRKSSIGLSALPASGKMRISLDAALNRMSIIDGRRTGAEGRRTAAEGPMKRGSCGLQSVAFNNSPRVKDSIELKGLHERIGEMVKLETPNGIVRFRNVAKGDEPSCLRVLFCDFCGCLRWWANFWMERTDNLIGGTVLLCLFILSFLPLQHIQSVVLFNRKCVAAPAMRERRSSVPRSDYSLFAPPTAARARSCVPLTLRLPQRVPAALATLSEARPNAPSSSRACSAEHCPHAPRLGKLGRWVVLVMG